ncbi:MAG: phosphatase PAP2 family protein [Marinilabiliaceae bacterium]|jgi:undecaprenyl-diphosphatase|nr:phosphatase PAP2 family protein [Marinilabiliaceae bacterium]
MLEQVDKTIFLFLNSHHSPFWDQIMWYISGRYTWVPLYLAILIMAGIKEKRRLLVLFPLIILTITLCDQVSVHCFKNVFERLRPCREPELEGLVHIVRNKCPGLYGFVSSHAANTFGLAFITLNVFRLRWYSIAIISWATLIAYSRVYLGVHYPGDVLGGALLGALIGYTMYLLYSIGDKRFMSRYRFFGGKAE